MRKLLFLFALGLMISLGAQTAFAASMYTSYNESTKTLTYYYDSNYGKSDRPNSEYYGNGVDPRWANYYSQVEKVVIDPSMENAMSLTTMNKLFYGGTSNSVERKLSNVTSITGLNYLPTTLATGMIQMFYGCESLTSVDLSSFDTHKVTSMFEMFKGCKSLKKLDLRSFATANVVNMSGMFEGCESLTDLSINKFNTEKVETMYRMFYGCKALTSVTLTNFSTSKLENVAEMFCGCESLKILDFSGFDVSKVQGVWRMFKGCSSLTTIYSNIFWSEKSKVPSDDPDASKDMFTGCVKLSSYSSSKTDILYARPGTGGYFSTKKRVYTSYDSSSKTLTYYYDIKNGERVNVEFYNPATNQIAPRWSSYCKDVKKVVIDESMSSATLTSTRAMFNGGNTYSEPVEFYELSNVTSITGLDNLKTARVTDMSYMFYWLPSLTSLNLSSFVTPEVTDMRYMFFYCKSLTSLNLSGLSTAKVTNMWGMFGSCENLTSLDLSKFRLTNLTNSSRMFDGCKKLQTIYCNVNLNNQTGLTQSDEMFYGCSALKGQNNTAYSSSKVNKEYARPDVSGNPGYFTDKKAIFATISTDGTTMNIYYGDVSQYQYANLTWNPDGRGTSNMTDEEKQKITKVVIDNSVAYTRPTTCLKWFYGMKNLTKIEGINYLNTSECVSMQAMFSGCNNLESLDVSGFNTAKVTNMSSMFYGCSKLTTIDVKNFDTENVTTMYCMFYNCTKVNLLNVANFNTAKVTNMEDMFGGCETVTNLNLSHFNTAKVTNMRYIFSRCKALKALQLQNLNTAKVTDMSYMFNGCSNLKAVYLLPDITKLTTAKCMFYNCSLLETIYCDTDFSKSSATTDDMFYGCTSLKGQYNTAYTSSKIDKSYARPDHGTNLPGYFSAWKEIYTYRDGNTLYYRYNENYSSSNTNMELYDPIAQPDAIRWKDCYN